MRAGWAAVLGLVFSLGCSVANAATIDLANYQGVNGANLPVVTVDGELLAEDIYAFQHVVDLVGDTAAVELNSPGGNLEAGIAMGRLIHRKQFVTVVRGTCASACALAWLAGRIRFAAPDARIGFHVAYVGGEMKVESGLGNALVGHYVGELGMSENIVRYVTSAAPDGMQWLSSRDASLLGLEVASLDGTDTAASAAMPVTAYAPEEQAQPVPSTQATLGLDQANTSRAVANAFARYRQAGISGLAESSAACWQVVRTKRSLDKVQYCRVLDMVGTSLNKVAVGKLGRRAHLAYFEEARRIDDAVAGLISVGFNDADVAGKLENIWNSQVQQAVGMLASNE